MVIVFSRPTLYSIQLVQTYLIRLRRCLAAWYEFACL